MAATRYFSLGRFAMRDALRYSGVGNGDLVMLPSFICRDLLAAVAEVGANSVFYDVDESLRPTSLDPSKPIKAIIAVNYFGFAQELEIFRDFASKTGAIVIEDNAHGCFSRDEDNQLLGSREKFGITSFRKTLHVDDGAILTTTLDDGEIAPQLPYDNSHASTRNRLLRLVSTFESRTRIPTVAVGQIISRCLRLITTGSQLPVSDEVAETKIPGVPNPHRTSIESLQHLDEDIEIARRRNLYLKLQPQVVAIGAKPIFDSLPANTCPYGLPVYGGPDLRQQLAKLARKNRVTLMSWPDLPNAVLPLAPNFYKQVWLLNFK